LQELLAHGWRNALRAVRQRELSASRAEGAVNERAPWHLESSAPA